MPRPDRSPERRRELAPVLARAFAELGYRRATTTELAERCGVQEKALYRLWPDKRAMFLAALDQVFAESEAEWNALARVRRRGESTASRLLAHAAQHHGEQRLYRIVFAGLSETDAVIETDRYICWPGQALTYMLGQRQIQALRRQIEERDGSRFDLREFHDQVLGHGSLPLATLARELPTWVTTPA